MLAPSEKKIGFGVNFYPVHCAFVVGVVSLFVSDPPKLGGKEVKRCVVNQSVTLLRKEMNAFYAHQIITYSRHIAIKRKVRGRHQRVGFIAVIQSRSHYAHAKLGVCAVMRTSDDAEIKLFVLFFFVRFGKISQ